MALAEGFERNVHCLLGLPFDAVNTAEAVRRIRDAAACRRPCFFATPNVNILVACLADENYRDSIICSDFIIADGMPLVWIARLLRIPIIERVAGSTLIDKLRFGGGARMSVFFLGGGAGVAEAACRRLTSEDGGLTCAGYESPGFGSVEEMSTDDIIQRINASQADFLIVSLGARKGQAWIEHNRHRLNVPVVSYLGATVNFVAGGVNRAPAWMQNSGLEWLWRIKEEPTLWPRYYREGLILLSLLVTRVLPYAWYLRRHYADAVKLAAASVETCEERHNYIVRLRGAWTQWNVASLRECFSSAIRAEVDVMLDMGEVTHVDSAFVGLVILLQVHQKHRGRRLFVVSVPDPVRRVIKYCCAEYLFSSTARSSGNQSQITD